jgi:hypothetical protein
VDIQAVAEIRSGDQEWRQDRRGYKDKSEYLEQ